MLTTVFGVWKIRTNLQNIGLRTKLLSIFTLVFTVSLLIQIAYIIPYFQEVNIQQASIHHDEIAHEITREGEQGLVHIESTLHNMSHQAVFRTMDIDNQTETMMQYIETNSEINSLSVMNSTGWFVTGTMSNFEVYTSRSYAESSFFSVPFEQNITNFGTPFSHEVDTVVMSISVPIESYTGEIIGVLMGSATINDVIDSIYEYPFEPGTFAYLLDQRGILMAHSEIDIFNLDGGPLSLNYSSFSVVQDALRGETNVIGIYYHIGTPYLAIAVPLEVVDWYLIMEVPMNIVIAEGNVLATNLLWLNLLVFGIGFVAIFGLAEQIVAQRNKKTVTS